MNSYLLLVILIKSCHQLTIENNYVCTCKQLINQLNCQQNLSCYWDQVRDICIERQCSIYTPTECLKHYTCQLFANECIEVGCPDYTTPNQCYTKGLQCYWYIPTSPYLQPGCVNLVSCDKLRNASEQSCYEANPLCAYNAKDKQCVDLKDNKCSSQIESTCTQTNEGFCQVYQNGECGVKNCINLTEAECKLSSPYCIWTTVATGGNCSSASCQLYHTEHNCKVAGLAPIGSHRFIVCSWNPLTEVCSDASTTSQLSTPESCYEYTLGTYRWNNISPNQGSCTKCTYSLILFAIIIPILI